MSNCKKATDVTWYCDNIDTEIIGTGPCAECPNAKPDEARMLLDRIRQGVFPDGSHSCSELDQVFLDTTKVVGDLIKIRELAEKAATARSAKNAEEALEELKEIFEPEND